MHLQREADKLLYGKSSQKKKKFKYKKTLTTSIFEKVLKNHKWKCQLKIVNLLVFKINSISALYSAIKIKILAICLLVTANNICFLYWITNTILDGITFAKYNSWQQLLISQLKRGCPIAFLTF